MNVFVIFSEQISPNDKATDAEIVDVLDKFDGVKQTLEDAVGDAFLYYDEETHWLDFSHFHEPKSDWDLQFVDVRTRIGNYSIGRYTVQLREVH